MSMNCPYGQLVAQKTLSYSLRRRKKSKYVLKREVFPLCNLTLYSMGYQIKMKMNKTYFISKIYLLVQKDKGRTTFVLCLTENKPIQDYV